MATSDKTMEELIAARANYKGRVTQFKNFLASLDPSAENISVLKLRLKRLEQILDKYEDVQFEIEQLNPDQARDRDLFEQTYFQAVVAATDFIKQSERLEEIDAVLSPQAVPPEQSSELFKPILPKFELPKFSGKQDEWETFYELFCSLIDQNKALPLVQKHHYLRLSLSGPAAQLLESLPITGDNYSVACYLLKQRYDNPHLNIQRHVRALFNLEAVRTENVAALRNLLDNAQRQVRALEALKEPIEHWDTLLTYLITSKLDPTTLREWEMEVISKRASTFSSLCEFLNSKCKMMFSLQNGYEHRRQKAPPVQFNSSRAYNVVDVYQCTLCKQSHTLYQCATFKDKSVEERRTYVQKSKRCFNCLSSRHHVKACESTRNCFYCNERHHTLLHRPSQVKSSAQTAYVVRKRKQSDQPKKKTSVKKNPDFHNKTAPQLSISSHGESKEVQSLNHNATTIRGSHVLLSTAVVQIQDSKGQWIPARCLLDSAATHDFISKEFATQLNIPRTKTDVTVTGINKRSTEALSYVKIKLKDSYSGKFHCNLNCLVIDHIGSNIPSSSFPVRDWKVPKILQLADPAFNQQAPVDILLGAEMFWKVLLNQSQQIQPGILARLTKLGWILTGKFTSSKPSQKTQQCHFTDCVLQDKLEKFWELEEVASSQEVCDEEDSCEKLYKETTTRTKDGRFTVTMPRTPNFHPVVETRPAALRCLYSIENRFKKDAVVQSQYVEFMHQYESLDHMEIVKQYQPTGKPETPEIVYLSHHPVWKDDEQREKIRVVFNGSLPNKHGISLNDTLLTGPSIQTDLFSSLANFRLHKIAVAADIEKMYRQVLIAPHQRDLQRVLWRASSDQPIKTFALKTVTYGLKPSSFLAVRTLKELALQDGDLYCPEAKSALLKSFYVDDYLQSFSSVEEAKHVTSDLTSLLKGGGFPLKKWQSNSISFLQSTPESDQVLGLHEMYKDDSTVKILGLYWNTYPDTLSYRVRLDSTPSTTKRSILSEIASIFDPLQYLAPTIVTAKIIMQDLWSLKLDWDEKVPTEVLSKWLKYRQDLLQLNHITIDRKLCADTSIKNPTLHIFCDSSEKAYGCCAYIVNEDNNVIESSLLCAKSKVAPLKKVTLPRLELCGALMAAEMKTKLLNCLQISIKNTVLWTDSMIVLAWLAKPSSTWNVFVANRVSKIQTHSSTDQWRYVSSSENPADLVSRGCSASKLLTQSLYWNGPHWLTKPERYWPTTPNSGLEINLEMESKVQVYESVVQNENFLSRFSSWHRMVRVTAYILRWKRKVLEKVQPATSFLSQEELQHAATRILKLTQAKSFSEEYHALNNGSTISKKSRLTSLNPFMGEDGLLRVGGRLSHSSLSPDQKFPIILPPNHHITTLIIRNLHYKTLHAGPRSLLYIVREKYWPVNGLHAVNSVTKKCLVCFKTKPRPIDQLMGDLPSIRVTPQRPFHTTGIDYAGPFFINVSSMKSRKPIPEKAYIVLFVCMVTGAVHLELVTDYSTTMFLAALNRFVSRRGKPGHIYSDNARNFTGAAEELRKAIVDSDRQAAIQDYTYQNGIQWHFIPPYSPSMGGRWESLVKIVKQHIKKTVTKLFLRYEEFNSLLISIEGIVNSRPISPLSMDPSDLIPLTPAHFLIGESITSLPDSHSKKKATKLQIHWRQIRELRLQFWKRWKQEYLNLLQRRNKWQTKKPNLKEGDLVIMKNNTMPLVWNMARVVKLHSGSDGLCRVIELNSPSGLITRSISAVCPLPIAYDSPQ